MKRIATILLLFVLLFNWFGYRILIAYLETRANTQLETALNQSMYSDDQLQTIKVPVTYLPYYNNSETFERVDGQIEIKGIEYKYVKKRIYHDSLEMLCIPNHEVMKLQRAENEFFKFANDLQPEKKTGRHSLPVKTISLDAFTMNDLLLMVDLHLPVNKHLFYYFCSIRPCYSPTTEQPPDLITVLA